MRAGQGICGLRQGILGHFRPLLDIFGAKGLLKDTFLFEGRGCIPLLLPLDARLFFGSDFQLSNSSLVFVSLTFYLHLIMFFCQFYSYMDFLVPHYYQGFQCYYKRSLVKSESQLGYSSYILTNNVAKSKEHIDMKFYLIDDLWI